MYLLGYTTYMYKFSIILMSHIGRSLFFGRASLGWLAVLIPDRSLIIAKLVYCVPKGSGSFYVGHLWGWPFSYSQVTGVMYVRYWGTTPRIICVTVETPLKSNWPSLLSIGTPQNPDLLVSYCLLSHCTHLCSITCSLSVVCVLKIPLLAWSLFMSLGVSGWLNSSLECWSFIV